MPFFDRFWWALLVGGLLLIAAVPVILAWQISGLSPDLGALGVASCWGVVAVLLAIIGAFFLIAAFQARDRKRRWLAALMGDRAAIPPANVETHPDHAPDVSREPLVLAWRATLTARLAIPVALFISSAIALGVLGALALAALLQIFGPSQIPEELRAFGEWDVWNPLSLMVAACCLLLLIVLPALWDPILLGGRIQIVATGEGIHYKAPLRRPRLVRWEDARLLEVGQAASSGLMWNGARPYTLFGAHDIVSWHDLAMPSQQLRPIATNKADMERRLRAMLNLIHAKSGLTPRTFDEGLRMKEPPPPPAPETTPGASRPGHPPFIQRVVAVTLALALLLIVPASALAIIVLPLTTLPPLNLAVAGSLILPLPVLTIWGAISSRRERGRPKPTPLAHPGDVTAPDDPRATYALATRKRPPAVRLRSLLLGLALVPDLAPGILAFASLTDPAHHLIPDFLLPTPMGYLAAFLLGTLGAVGLLLLFDAASAGRIVVRLEPGALVHRNGPITVRVKWDELERLAFAGGHGDERYEVGAKGHFASLNWPADPAKLDSSFIIWDAEIVSPAQLAVLVSARSGIPLVVEHSTEP